MAKVVSLRLPEDLLEWADVYAESRGVSRTDLLVEGLRSFKDDCDSGVPEIRAAIARQSSVKDPAKLAALQGVGNCPERPGELGHIWTSPRENPERPCVHCGLLGRQSRPVGEMVVAKPNYLDMATGERHRVFSGVAASMQSGTGKARELTDAQQAKAAEIVEDKKRRDAIARESGVGRPGQLRGK
jgi:hypothetical protein